MEILWKEFIKTLEKIYKIFINRILKIGYKIIVKNLERVCKKFIKILKEKNLGKLIIK